MRGIPVRKVHGCVMRVHVHPSMALELPNKALQTKSPRALTKVRVFSMTFRQIFSALLAHSPVSHPPRTYDFDQKAPRERIEFLKRKDGIGCIISIQGQFRRWGPDCPANSNLWAQVWAWAGWLVAGACGCSWLRGHKNPAN